MIIISTIEQNLNDILNARYGKDVRQAIHDGIEACYEDGKAGAVDLIARQRIDEALANKDGIEIIQYKLIDNLSTEMIEMGETASVTASWQVPSTIAQKLEDGEYEYWFLAVSTGWGTIGTNPTWGISGTTVTMNCSVINTSNGAHSILVKMVALLVSKWAGFSDAEAVKPTANGSNTIEIDDSYTPPTMGSKMLKASSYSVPVSKSILILGNGLIDGSSKESSFESILQGMLSESVYNTCKNVSLSKLPDLCEAVSQSKWSVFSEETSERIQKLSEQDFSSIVLSVGFYDRENEDEAVAYLKNSIEILLTSVPTLSLYICGPNYMAWKDDYGLLNQSSDSYTTYIAKIKNVAEEYHLPYIDNYDELGINALNRLSYLTVEDDGVFLNTLGKERVAKNISKRLNA